ncbi:MAG: hypothetical protein LBK74_01640 [Treponema sp.]|jgi:hypothetical protein|nr:hypothetical protein [Treponema sp.]
MAMDAERYKKLKKLLGSYGSWALWDPDDMNNTAYIESNYRKLKTEYVFVGLNTSRAIEDQSAWTNYHFTHRGGKETRLAKVFTGTKFEGAYMTDIIKGFTSTGSAKALDEWAASEELRAKSIKVIQKEFKALGKVKMVYSFGKDACRLWHEIPKLAFYPAKIVTHFAARGNAFEENIRDELGIVKPSNR